MGTYICKQPNGLYCRFSSVVDCPTMWNMTREDYINYRMAKAKEDAIETLEKHLQPFERVIEDFIPNNMTPEMFSEFLEDVSKED